MVKVPALMVTEEFRGAGEQRSVQQYEIRTFGRDWRSSLVLFAQCPSDMAAILVARGYARKSQAVEVWLGDKLVYRVGVMADNPQRAVRK